MFRSIRWRLVASYVLLTVLTVSLVGVLALSLVERYVEQRVVNDLTANAEAVARQAAPLMWPVRETAALRQLAQTSSFLGDAQVKILDAQNRTLADSGTPSGVDQFMWLMPPLDPEPVTSDPPWIVVMPSGRRTPMRLLEQDPFLERLSSNVRWTVARRMSGIWSNRFTFDEDPGEQGWFPFPSNDATPTPAGEAATEKTPPPSTRQVVVPVGETDEPLGYVALSSSPDFAAEAVETTRRAFLLAGGGAAALAVVVGLLIGHSLTTPLRKLTAAASGMGEDLSTRAPVGGKDEIGQLARQFNRMAERLEASFAELADERDALRRFVADASHQLRTPITALKNFNELLQGAAADDPVARDEFLKESGVQLDQLAWITHNLLDLSRLDAGLGDLDRDRHDVGQMIEAVSVPFRVVARDQEITFSVRLSPSALEIECDRARIELALSNLLDNAFRFTPPGGRVEIGAKRASASSDKEAEVWLWVQDSGPGIEPADRPRIFERFYRGRESHHPGSGLGLAIVQSVVQAHGGRVWVESEVERGSRFVLALPHSN